MRGWERGERRRPRCRSLVQANTISVTVQQDRMTRSHYCSLCIYPDTHINSTWSHILQIQFPHTITPPPTPVSLKSDKWLSKHTRAHGLTQITPFLECVTHERTCLNAHNMPPVHPPLPCSSFLYQFVEPASGLAFSCHLRVCKPPDHMGSEGLSGPPASYPPWRSCCLRGNTGASCHHFSCFKLLCGKRKRIISGCYHVISLSLLCLSSRLSDFI